MSMSNASDEKIEVSHHEDIEKAPHRQQAHLHRTDSDIEKENGEVHLFADASTTGLKLAKDGKTVLIPQPSDDPADPLNWSEWKKTSILLILSFCAFVGDFQSGAGIPLLGVQSEEWHMSPNDVNKAGNLSVLFVGVGGLLWIPPLYFWGRLPVLFWTQFLGTAMVLGTCFVQTFDQYYVLRPMTSIFLTAGQVIGLTFIKDMYCFHDHARKIGLWVFIFLSSPYFGPFLGGFMVYGLGTWRPIMWLVFAVSTLMLVLIVLFADETWYDRTLAQQPAKKTGVIGRIYDLVGITGWQTRKYKPNAFPSTMRLLEVFTKPVSCAVNIIYAISFMWAVGINITSSIIFAEPKVAGGYGFSTNTISFLYFTPLVALFIGEVFGHKANDWVANRYIRSHGGVFKPECRLYTYFCASPLMIAGLVIVGQALHRQLNVGAVVIGWGLYVVGVMISSVSLVAYILDSFPTASGEVSAMVNLARTMSGFSVGYFQLDWGLKSGFDVSFGIQAALVAGALFLTILLAIFGERIRKAGGHLHYAAHQ